MNNPALSKVFPPHLHIFTDGGSRGNPGPAAAGIVIKDNQNQLIYQFGRYIGVATNNLAEYQGVIEALAYLNTHKIYPLSINFFLDSTLVVNQLNGLWKVKNSHLRQKVIEVRQLEGSLGSKNSYRAIPRQQNAEADAQVNLALDHHLA